jgi:DNA-directed RNA polymerase
MYTEYSYEELLEKEKEFETSADVEAVDRYNDKLNKAADRAVYLPEIKRLKVEVPALATAIAMTLRSGPMGKIRKNLIGDVPPMEIALLTIRFCLNNYQGNQTVQALAGRLMEEIRVHKDDKRFAESFKAYHSVVQRNIKSDHPSYKHKVMSHARRRMGVEDTIWNKNDRILTGTYLLDKYCETCGTFEKADFPMKPRYDKKLKRNVTAWGITVKPTEQMAEWLVKNHQHCATLTPVFKPMVVPPKPWTSTMDGGYVSIARSSFPSCRLIRGVSTKWLAENESLIDPAVYEAVNFIQQTPYRVNRRVLEVMEELKGSTLAGMLEEEAPKLRLPPKPLGWPDVHKHSPELKRWKKKNRAAYDNWMTKASKIFKEYYHEMSQRTALNERMRLAGLFKDYQRIYFPVNLDWRGRTFCMSSPFLSPQGDDGARGLLEYAEGKELTAEGFIEFCIHGANVFGEDKLSEAGRLDWVDKHHDWIMQTADDPYGESQLEWWTNSDKPWEFLAWCFEYGAYMRDRSFKSHLVCHIDQTCSGLQHWSAVLSDEKGAERVAMVPKALPDDIYQAVADRVEERIKHNHDPIAVAWRGKVTRTITKRNVMTKLYGATMPGMREQVLTELQKLDKKAPQGQRYLEGCPVDNFKAAQFISGENDNAMRDIISRATKGMDFVQQVARHTAKAGVPIKWTSPIGLPVQQTYWKTEAQRVETYWLSIRIPKTPARLKKEGPGLRVQLNVSYHNPKLGIQQRKAENSIAPNFIHSMDASHLMFIALGWKDKGKVNFTPIHDSFGTHASDLPELHKVVRDQFIFMYEDKDYLYEFVRQVSADCAKVLNIERPTRGKLDLSKIKDATYFCR